MKHILTISGFWLTQVDRVDLCFQMFGLPTNARNYMSLKGQPFGSGFLVGVHRRVLPNNSKRAVDAPCPGKPPQDFPPGFTILVHPLPSRAMKTKHWNKPLKTRLWTQALKTKLCKRRSENEALKTKPWNEARKTKLWKRGSENEFPKTKLWKRSYENEALRTNPCKRNSENQASKLSKPCKRRFENEALNTRL